MAEVGDVIVAVNGKPARDSKLQEDRGEQQLHSKVCRMLKQRSCELVKTSSQRICRVQIPFAS